jgi:hypothetical protein
MSATHTLFVTERFGRRIVIGDSEWTVKIGNGRLVKPMGRQTVLSTASEVRRWAARYPDEIKASDVDEAVKTFAPSP